MNKWLERALVVGIFVVCAAAYIGARRVVLPMMRAPDGHYVLADPDSYMRWRLVTRAVSGEGVRIRWVNDDNAPYGRMNEWMSPMTILGVGLVRAGEKFGGMTPARALEWGGLWLGPIVGLLSLSALGWLGWRAGGWSLAACWMAAWPVLEDVIQITRFGHTDHDSLHQLLFICVIGGCLACAQRPSVIGGGFVGLASALAMWSAGTELLPTLALVAMLAVYETGWLARDEKRTGFWRGWWIIGLAGTAAAWLFEFWPKVFHGHLEFISVWHVIAWCVGGALLECLAQWRMTQLGRWLAVIGAIGLITLAAAATRGFDWRHLHIVQDEQHQRLTAGVSETQPFARDGLEAAARKAWWKHGLLPVCVLGLAYRSASLSRRVRWLGIVLVVFLTLTWVQIRWSAFFAPALVMTAGVAVRHRWQTRPSLCAGLVVLATLPQWILAAKIHRNVGLVHGNSIHGPYSEMLALRAASNCMGQAANDGIVLAAWDQGGVLAGSGKVRVIGSAYWPNFAGLRDTYELFTTSSQQQFFELVRKRRIDFVLIPSPARLERAVWQSWVALHVQPPTRAEAFGAYIWQVARSEKFKIVSCGALSNLAPDWRIVKLPADERGGDE